MCVILVAETAAARPGAATMKAAERANQDGIGMAWIAKGRVKWIKDLSLKHATELAGSVPAPFVVHFRLASIGGVHASLCHPFPVEAGTGASLLSGAADCVVFHNGHWPAHADAVRAALEAGKGEAPALDEPWSDSRSMAWLAATLGPGYLKFVPPANRLAVLERRGFVVRLGDGWSKIAGGTWASNTRFVGAAPAKMIFKDQVLGNFRGGKQEEE